MKPRPSSVHSSDASANVVDATAAIVPAEGGGIIDSNGAGNPPEISSDYGVGPDILLRPRAQFESFKTYECFFTGGFETGSLAFRNMILERFPWTRTSWLTFCLGYGVAGNFTFTADVEKQDTRVLEKWLAFFKRYRDILQSNIVHLAYPDGVSIDAILHVNPAVKPAAFLLAFNPTAYPLRRSIVIPVGLLGEEKGLRLLSDRKPEIRLIPRKTPLSPGIIEGDLAPGKVMVLDLKLPPRGIASYEVWPT